MLFWNDLQVGTFILDFKLVMFALNTGIKISFVYEGRSKSLHTSHLSIDFFDANQFNHAIGLLAMPCD